MSCCAIRADALTEVLILVRISSSVSVLPVNDSPSMSCRAINPFCRVLAREYPNFVTTFAPGGGIDEVNQGISDFLLSIDNPSLFSILLRSHSTELYRFSHHHRFGYLKYQRSCQRQWWTLEWRRRPIRRSHLYDKCPESGRYRSANSLHFVDYIHCNEPAHYSCSC